MSDLIRREDAYAAIRGLTRHIDRIAAITALPAVHLATNAELEALIAERDHAWAMVAKADTQMGQSLADHLQAKAQRDRLREVLIELIQHTHNCERELTEDLHHVDFCGESVPLTNAREALKKAT